MIDFLKVAEVIERSPQGVKDILFSTDIGDLLYGLADIYDIGEEKTMQMVDEVGYVILGLKNKLIFFDSLLQIGIDKEPAKVIAEEVSLQIFSELDKIKNTAIKEQETAPIPQPHPMQQQPAQTAPPAPQEPTSPPTWQHTQPERSAPAPVQQMPPPPPTAPPIAPPAIPQYQKPLTNVPAYRNADLYKKP